MDMYKERKVQPILAMELFRISPQHKNGNIANFVLAMSYNT